MKKKMNNELSARNEADSSTNADKKHVSQHRRKPDVVRSPNVLSAKSKLENKVKVYEWFYGQLESLIKSANLALNRKDNAITFVGNIKLESCPNTNKKKGKGIR